MTTRHFIGQFTMLFIIWRTILGLTSSHHAVVAVPTQRPETVCERWRASLMEHYGGRPGPEHFLPQCDASGEFTPVQCYGESSYCWCVDKDGREVPGTRSQDKVKPACKCRSSE